MKLDKVRPEVIMWGGTGQAKVMRPVIESYGAKVVAVFDDTAGLVSPFKDVEILHGYESFKKWIKSKDVNNIGFCLTIGNPHGRVRIKLHEILVKDGLTPLSVSHCAAWISDNAKIGDGAQVHAGALIMEEAVLGRECIINTKASIDHECVLSDGVEVGPGATLCGCVHVGTNAWICAGATVLPRVKIGEDAVVGAGAVVTKNVPAGVTVVGVPAREMVKR